MIVKAAVSICDRPVEFRTLSIRLQFGDSHGNRHILKYMRILKLTRRNS